MMNQLLCQSQKITATSMPHGKPRFSFVSTQLPRRVAREANFDGSRPGRLGAGDWFVEPDCPGVALRRVT